jgi:hypothetical protein
VKPLKEVQSVQVRPGQRLAGRPEASVASRRVTDGAEAYTARKQAVRIQLRKLSRRDADAVSLAEGSIQTTDMRGCSGVAGVPSPGHAFKWTSREPRRASYSPELGNAVPPNPKWTRSQGKRGRPMGSEETLDEEYLLPRETGGWQERVGEQSYEPIVPVKVGNRRAPKGSKGAATVPTGGKGRTGRRIGRCPAYTRHRTRESMSNGTRPTN